MTSEVARNSIAGLLDRSGRRQLSRQANPEQRFLRFHQAVFGPGKVGKSHLFLSARTSEVRATKKEGEGPFAKSVAGDVIIPSRPIPVAHANFDRDASSVIVNLADDAQIVTEDFYLDGDGNPVLFPTAALYQKILERLHKFMGDAVAAAAESGDLLFFIDGGTIVWEDVREATLPPPAGTTPEGEPHHLPRQYGVSNKEMRAEVMQRVYSMPIHTGLTMEARDKWSSASKPDIDAETGEPLKIPDGWNKTEHYVDCLAHMRLVRRASGLVREAVPHVGLRPAIIGRPIPEPTFAKLYTANLGQPLLLKTDWDTFLQAEKAHGTLSF